MQSGHFTSRKNLTWRKQVLFGTVFISIGLLCIFRIISPFTFYNNDDVTLQMIVSGDISGTPSPYMIHSHYLLGLLLSGLYSLFPALPWYGLWFCFCVGVCIFCITWRLLGYCRNWRQGIVAVGLESVFILFLLFPVISRAQFTVLAGLTGATALFWALTMKPQENKDAWRSITVLCGLAVMTYFIRSDVFYMLLPAAGVLWIAKYFLSGKGGKKKFRCYLVPVFLLLGISVLLAGIQEIAYSGPEWKPFREFTQARALLYDYTGFPNYEQEKELYQALGISEESYEAIVHHYMLLNNPDVTTENLTELAERASETAAAVRAPKTFTELLQVSMTRFYSTNFRLLSFLLTVLYVGLVFIALLFQRYRLLVPPALLLFVQTAMWMGLNYKGRFPDRVAHCLYFIELFALLAFYFAQVCFGHEAAADRDDRKSKEEAGANWLKNMYYPLCGCIVLACMALCLYYGRTLVAENAQRSKALLKFSENYQELSEYCGSQSQSRYLVDLYTTAYYTADLLALREAEPVNFLSLGGWTAKSPLTQERLSLWGMEDAERAVLENPQIYVVFGDSSEFTEGYFMKYYQSKYPGCTFRLEDTLTCKSGTNFYIYKGSYEEPFE